jgi:hypothetical protein
VYINNLMYVPARAVKGWGRIRGGFCGDGSGCKSES